MKVFDSLKKKAEESKKVIVFPGSPVKVSGYPFMGREVFQSASG